MKSNAMINLHQRPCPWTWQLEAGQALTLAAAGTARWLRVDHGCLWLTATRPEGGAQVEDIWLGAGQSLPLPAGTAWVLQAWPSAGLSVLQPAPAPTARAASSLRGVWPSSWRLAQRGLRWLVRHGAWPRALA